MFRSVALSTLRNGRVVDEGGSNDFFNEKIIQEARMHDIQFSLMITHSSQDIVQIDLLSLLSSPARHQHLATSIAKHDFWDPTTVVHLFREAINDIVVGH